MTETAIHQDNRPAIGYTPVRRAAVDFYFWEAWALIEPAVARGGLYTQESVLGALKAGEMQLWCAERGDEMVMALVTEIAHYPARKICAAMFVGGRDLEHCMPILADIEQWARENGCDRIVADGRRGWARKLKGYVERNTTVVKDLTHA